MLQALLKCLAEDQVRLHMPGHGGGAAAPPELLRHWGADVFRFDLTELPGLDNLAAPQGIIARAQEKTARLFGAEASFFLVNGSTVGLQAAAMACLRPGEELLVPRCMHRSLWAGLIFSGAWPVYVPVEWEPEFGIPLAATAEAWRQTWAQAPGARAVAALHPNYFGICGDLPAVIELARQRDQAVVVDEAHGAGFRFSPHLPPSALQLAADVVVQSWHKTLTSLTQTAVLHCQGELVRSADLSRCLQLLQTSSPSYLLLLSLDLTRQQMEEQGGELWARAVELAELIRRKVGAIPGLRCLGEEIRGRAGVGGWDPTRLVIDLAGLAGGAENASRWLAQHCRLQVEMAEHDCMLCLVGPGSSREDAEVLVNALRCLAERAGGQRRPPDRDWISTWDPLLRLTPEVKMRPRDAFFQTGRMVDLEQAAGEISADLICPFPPGIPVLAPGELIRPEQIEFIRAAKRRNICFQGSSDPDLAGLRVVAAAPGKGRTGCREY